MYLPPHFEEPRIDVLHRLMRARPLATLVALTPDGLEANHVPLQLCAEEGRFGALRGHVARANPLWRERVDGVEALAIFQGPQAYVSPSWYPTKREHGKVVPTWNYMVVHAYGFLHVMDDPVWVRRQIEALTKEQEAAFAEPWTVSDAPPEYADRMIAAVVGIEIDITRLTGKWKLSQNQPARNRAGVVAALKAREDDIELAQSIEAAAREAP